MPTQAPEDKYGPSPAISSKESSCLASSTAVISAAPLTNSTSSEMTKDSPVEQAKNESIQLDKSNTTSTAVPAEQQMAPVFLKFVSNKPREHSKTNASTLKHLHQTNILSRLLSQLNNKAFSRFASNESQLKQLFQVINGILKWAKLPNWSKSKDELEKLFIAEQYKLLKFILDSLITSNFDQSTDDRKELIVNVCACFPVTTGPMVYRRLSDALPKLVEQVISDLESVYLENSNKLHKQKSCDHSIESEKEDTKHIEVGLTVIKDRYSNENIVLSGRSAPQQMYTLNEPSGQQVHSRELSIGNKLSSQLTLLNIAKFCEQIRKLIQIDIKSNHRQLSQWHLLWDKLNKCLELLGQGPPGQLVCLQSVIETFLLVQAPPPKPRPNVDSLDQQLAHIKQCANRLPAETNQKSSAEPDNWDKMAKSIAPQFFNFVTTNRLTLNQILRQYSGKCHWASGPFGILADYSQLLDFDMKQVFFRHELSRFDYGGCMLNIKRSNLLKDSFRQLAFLPVSDWKGHFGVGFIGEEGVDAGGLLREWFLVISREMFNQNYGLFIPVGDQAIYTINTSSHCNSNHLAYFTFFGRLIGKAILDKQLVDCYFTRSLYKHMLGKPILYTDMEQEDKVYYNGLLFLLQHKLADIPGGTDMRFVYETLQFGVPKTIELVPDGQNVPVTDENKHHYVKLVCLEKMTGSIRTQLRAFLEGFYSLVPKRLISIFSEHELELLIAGLPTIDLDDLRRSVSYSGFDENETQMQWLWTALTSFDQTDRAKFLQFVTGTSKVPLGGFSATGRRIVIIRDYYNQSAGRLPSACTCSMALKLPVYESYDKQRMMILKAIQEGSEGYAFS